MRADLRVELLLLVLLSLFWGASYLFIKIAVAEIPPTTLIAARVSGAALFLLIVMRFQSQALPRDIRTWRLLGVQAFFNSIGAWTVLAWGQQFVDAGLASMLNSTSPIFVFLFTGLVTRHERLGMRKLLGAILGIGGVIMIVGINSLHGLGTEIAGELACLTGAALYAAAAVFGRRFAHISATATAAGTMMWASIVLVPLALILDSPWTTAPDTQAIAATIALSVPCTGFALLLYFRLVRTLGSLGVASQSYLRAGIGVILGIVFLGESFSPAIAAGLATAIAGVALINWPPGIPTGSSRHADRDA
jgi:drug/metabolite transporter (DMT)-like permease